MCVSGKRGSRTVAVVSPQIQANKILEHHKAEFTLKLTSHIITFSNMVHIVGGGGPKR